MDNITPKERILKKVRAGLLNKKPGKQPEVDLESSVYEKITEPLPEVFAQNFTQAGGKLVFCHNKFDLIDNIIDLQENKKWETLYCWDKKLKSEFDDIDLAYNSTADGLENAEVSITSCECLVARTGSIVTTSLKNSRSLIVAPKIHIVVAWIDQVVPDIKDGLKIISNSYGKNLPSTISFITGPSKTADIEMQLITGVHGPKELYVFLVNEKSPLK